MEINKTVTKRLEKLPEVRKDTAEISPGKRAKISTARHTKKEIPR